MSGRSWARRREELFDKNVATARETLTGAGNEDLLKSWSLLRGVRKMMTLPCIGVVRSFLMNHNIHHLTQLGVYLRLNDITVPGMYGSSAEDLPM